MRYKCLTVHQPWAELIREGEKTIEVRSWRTNYRGPLVICASAQKITVEYEDEDGKMVKETLPYGCTVAICHLVDCRPLVKEDLYDACMDDIEDLDWSELEGSWAWVLADIRPLPNIPVKGKQRIFECDLDLPV